MTIPRPEHPNPQFYRENWFSLNGEWQFETDPFTEGRNEEMLQKEQYEQKITVPFCPESALSGIQNTDFMECVWYKRTFTLPEAFDGGRVLLHIGACDYQTEVWVNGQSAGTHIGGYVSFTFDITPFVRQENTIVICAEDHQRSHAQPSGKQSGQQKSYQCFYTRTTGIWQSVWLECVPQAYIGAVKYTADTENAVLYVEAECQNAHGKEFSVHTSFQGTETGTACVQVVGTHAFAALQLSELHLWEPGNPALYDITLTLHDDTVCSYYGMRSIAYDDNVFYLNGKPVFQRLVLDQGFYPDGIYTAKDDAALKRDIELSMALGFNGARLHQKVFEPRFLYYCDKMGYLVWGEHANWGLDLEKPEAFKGFLPEWLEILRRDYSHPAIVGWCPFNETGGQDPELIKAVYDLTKAFDPVRPVIDCSGWAHIKTDIWDWHDYEQDPTAFREQYEPLKDRKETKNEIWAMARENTAKISFISEYGGIKWSKEGGNAWGYGQGPDSEEEFLTRFEGLTSALLSHPRMFGFCYTQLTDVEQEQNGLYTYGREAKFDTERIRKIVSQRAAVEK